MVMDSLNMRKGFCPKIYWVRFAETNCLIFQINAAHKSPQHP